MPSIIVAPSLDREKVQQRIVVTCDGGMATFHCPLDAHLKMPLGVPIDDIPLPHFRLQVWLRQQADKAIQRMAIRGYEYWDLDDIHVYGPYPSKRLHERILTLRDLNAAPKDVVGLVRNRANDDDGEVDYLLVANFVKKPEHMDEEALDHAPLPKELMV